MSIEFDCTQCQLRLRTSDETAGKQARCPQCGTLVPIPHPDDVPADDPAQGGRWREEHDESGGSARPGTHPFANPPLIDPYVSPVDTTVTSRGDAKRKIVIPAIGMMVGATIMIPVAAAYLLWLLQTGADEFVKEMAREFPDTDVEQLHAAYVITVVLSAAMLVVPLGIILGGVSMLRMKWYPMALTGTIMALLPCGPCCVFTLPFGIWGLIVLSDFTVRSAFQ